MTVLRRFVVGCAASTLAVAVASATAGVAAAPAAPNIGRALSSHCNPGYAEASSGVMKINGKPKGSADLKQGAVVLTKGEDSQADVCLQRGAIDCTVWGDSKIVVLPRELPDVIMQTVTKADVSCTATVKGTRKYLDVSHQKITLGALGLKPQQRPSMFSALGATAASAHVFTLSVRRARVVIKVRRGVTVVAPKNRLREGVVVGRNQQVTVQRGVPSEPTQSHETSRQRRQLDRYERRLPPPDTTAPSPFVIGPSNESSLRSPTFRFTSNEAGAVFSCSLNTPNDFRVCTDGQPFTHLPLGANHVFVKATDAAGNTTQHATRYDWFVEQNPIVYARGPAGGNTDIWTMDSDGANQKQLTHDSAHARTPEWSPDHTQIAFDSDVAGNYDIYVMSANGSKRQAVANDAVDERNPTWSPDGQEIAFERGPSGARDIYVISANGGRPRRLTSNQADDLDPAWSPDGQQIAFASTRGDNYDIYVINANGGQATDLTNTPDATEFGPAWSPSGDMIAFHRKVDRPVPVPNDIYVMNPDGSNQQKITQTGWDDVYPSWAPDGREIVFYSARVPESKDADIYFVSLDVKIEARLTNDADYDYLPDW